MLCWGIGHATAVENPIGQEVLVAILKAHLPMLAEPAQLGFTGDNLVDQEMQRHKILFRAARQWLTARQGVAKRETGNEMNALASGAMSAVVVLSLL